MSTVNSVSLHRHSISFIAAALIAIFAVMLGSGLAVALIALSVAVIYGMPHGALDLPRAQIELGVSGPLQLGCFLLSYLAAVGLCLLFWWLAPLLALSAFLIYSAWHFSEDWLADSAVARLSGAFSVIGAPSLLHFSEVNQLLSLISAKPTLLLTQIAGVSGLIGLVLTVALVVFRPGRAALEITVLWLLAYIAPPLVFFAVYYGALHAYRQSELTLAGLGDQRRSALLLAVGASLLLVSVSAAVIWLCVVYLTLDLSTALLRVVFITLAALTVPHMLLGKLIRLRSKDRSPQLL